MVFVNLAVRSKLPSFSETRFFPYIAKADQIETLHKSFVLEFYTKYDDMYSGWGQEAMFSTILLQLWVEFFRGLALFWIESGFSVAIQNQRNSYHSRIQFKTSCTKRAYQTSTHRNTKLIDFMHSFKWNLKDEIDISQIWLFPSATLIFPAFLKFENHNKVRIVDNFLQKLRGQDEAVTASSVTSDAPNVICTAASDSKNELKVKAP